MDQYVALLRGINVGGHQVPMAKLKKTLERIGCENVTTILASGNVVFEARKQNLSSLAKSMEATLTRTFGFSVPVFLLSKRAFEEFVKSEPFKRVKVTPETRLYVTFLSGKPKRMARSTARNREFQLVSVTDVTVCSVVRLSAAAGTVDLMRALEEEFGKDITTRNWNTVAKIVKALRFDD